MRKFALVGAGVIGKHHGTVIEQLADRIELVAVADVVPERAGELTARHGGRPYPSLTEAMAAEAVDVVVVCTPTGLHGEVAIEALDAGKHVIVEKPAEITVARTDEIIEAQRKAGTLVTVISQHRFDPATETTLGAIARGELGRITSGIASIDWWRGQTYYDSGDWRGTWDLDGGGALMNQGVHTVDLLVAALGRPVEDVATGVVRFESGALGVLHATTAAYPGLSARLQVHGDRGSAVIDNDQLVFFESGGGAGEKAYGTTSARKVPAAGRDPGQLSDAHRLQYLNFLAALDGTEQVRVDLATNRQSIGVITGAYESARTGRPVTLS
jgi:UDP-N-acetyl-2-amino-2-deoxyglucuronate dehydrogenase